MMDAMQVPAGLLRLERTVQHPGGKRGMPKTVLDGRRPRGAHVLVPVRGDHAWLLFERRTGRRSLR